MYANGLYAELRPWRERTFQSQWASPDPGLAAVILVAACGAAGPIVVRLAMCHACAG